MTMQYNFLILSLLFLIPGTLIFMARPDLRPVIKLMSLFSTPFAFTESLFYPSYWKPKFLFDLADIIGFGIEDLIFVVGLGAFTSTVYAFIFKAKYESINEVPINTFLKRAMTIFLTTFALVAVVALLGIEMIYGSFGIMLGISGYICLQRKDLYAPCILGGLASTMVYSLLCLLFGALIPGVFNLTWNTDQFLNIFFLGIPVEELMYGFASGAIATIFYPYVFFKRFIPN